MKLFKITLLTMLGFAGAAQAEDFSESLSRLNYHGVYTDFSNEFGSTVLTIGRPTPNAQFPFTFRIDYRDLDDVCEIKGYAKAIGNHQAFYQSSQPSAAMLGVEDGSIDYCTANFTFKRGSVEYSFSDCSQCAGGRAGFEGEAERQGY